MRRLLITLAAALTVTASAFAMESENACACGGGRLITMHLISGDEHCWSVHWHYVWVTSGGYAYVSSDYC